MAFKSRYQGRVLGNKAHKVSFLRRSRDFGEGHHSETAMHERWEMADRHLFEAHNVYKDAACVAGHL